MLQVKEWWLWGMCVWCDTSHIHSKTFQVWVSRLRMHEIDVLCQEKIPEAKETNCAFQILILGMIL